MGNFDFQQTGPTLQEIINSVGGKADQTDVNELRALYEALTQSDIIPVASADWPVSDPQQNVIYRVAGTSSYTDYMWNGTSFIPMATYTNTPTDIPVVGSTDVITAGGVANHGSAFDISEYNKNGTTLATYADLSAALEAVPSTVRKGGMSIKFVQSSDNNYVQYRYTNTDADTNSKFTNVANWKGESRYRNFHFSSDSPIIIERSIITIKEGSILYYKDSAIGAYKSYQFVEDVTCDFKNTNNLRLLFRNGQVITNTDSSDILPDDVILLNAVNGVISSGELYPYMINYLERRDMNNMVAGNYYEVFPNAVVRQPLSNWRIYESNNVYYWHYFETQTCPIVYPVFKGEMFKIKMLRRDAISRVFYFVTSLVNFEASDGEDIMTNLMDGLPYIYSDTEDYVEVTIPSNGYLVTFSNNSSRHIYYSILKKIDNNSLDVTLTNRNIPFVIGLYKGSASNFINFSVSNSFNRIVSYFPISNVKDVVIKDNSFELAIILYEDSLPTSKYQVIREFSTGGNTIEYYASQITSFNANMAMLLIRRANQSSLSDVTSIDDVIDIVVKDDVKRRLATSANEKTIKRFGLQLGYLSASTGLYPAAIEYYLGYKHTPRFLKVNGVITIKTLGIIGKIYLYGENQVYLGSSARIDIDTTSQEQAISFSSNARYYRIALQTELDNIDIEGYWDGSDEVYQKRPSNGYQALTFQVNAIRCLQSQSVSAINNPVNITTDSGVLHLPSNYCEHGVGVPLIIYVHGAANDYPVATSSFPASNPLAPEWDAAGYAQMDLDLIPDLYNNENDNSDGGSSDDAECIYGAYRWAIEHFNIRRDGVYLFGRSRGGQAVLHVLGKYDPNVMPIIAAMSNAGAHSLINYGITNSKDVDEWDLLCESYNLPTDERPTPNGTDVLLAQNNIYDFLNANIGVWWKKASVALKLLDENNSGYDTSIALLEYMHEHPRVNGVDNSDYLDMLKTFRFKSPVPLRFDWCVADTIQPWNANGGKGNYSAIIKDDFVNNLNGNAEYREWPTVSQSGTMPSGVSDRGHWHELFNLYDGDYILPNGVVVSNPSMARVEWLLWALRYDNRF